MADFAIGIIGAGLGGTLLARECLQRGLSVEDIALIDAGRAARASDAPGAIFHPFPGRSAAPHDNRLRQAEHTLASIRKWQRRLDPTPIVEAPMVRPLFDDDRGEQLRESWAGSERYPDWLDGGIRKRAELADIYPELPDFDEALVYRPAFCVDLGALTRRLLEELQSSGVTVRSDTDIERLQRRPEGWRLVASESSIDCRTVVLAVGGGLGNWFPNLAMRPRGGELWTASAEEVPTPGCIINASGHVAPRPGGGLAAGSTWFDPAKLQQRTDAMARESLRQRCGRLFPPLEGLETGAGTIWRGVRANFGDHQPLVGPVPGLDGVWVFGAFGSKGLLRIPLHADLAARALCQGEMQIPALSDPERMNLDKWDPSPGRFTF